MQLMYTHVSDDALFLDNLADGSSVDISTYNGVVSVSRSGQGDFLFLSLTYILAYLGILSDMNITSHLKIIINHSFEWM